MPRRPERPHLPLPSRQASEYLLACLSVFLSFLATLSAPASSPFLTPALSPSPVISEHSGAMTNLVFTVREMVWPLPEEPNQLRQSERHQLKPSRSPQPHPLPLLAWSNSRGGAVCETTAVISIDRGSRKSS